MISQSNENALLDAAIDHVGCKNDAGLSRALGVAPPVVSKIRHGKLPVGATLILTLHEVIGIPLATIRSFIPREEK